MLIGVSFALEPRWEWFIPLIFLFQIDRNRLVIALLLLFSSAGYVTSSYHFPELPGHGTQGTAYFQIHSLSKTRSHIGEQWVYKGTVQSFTAHERVIAKNIPLQLTLSESQSNVRPIANSHYLIQGVLKENDDGFYQLKLNRKQTWTPIENSWSAAEWRHLAKESVKSYIHNHISNPQSATFLSGLATGEFDDKVMSHEFARFGLQHIMAISGFHFAIIALILSSLLRLILPRNKAYFAIIFLLSSYFVFLGSSASILRAWIAIVLALGGFLLQKQSNGLNSLGVGLMVLLFLDPLAVYSIGFQFSFAVTAAILLLNSLCSFALGQFWDARQLHETQNMGRGSQIGYLLLQSFGQGIALALAVNIIALPLLIYHFQQFPLMSLFFNLFFPFLVSISMLFLLLGLMLPVLHSFNSFYTAFILNMTTQMPQSMDYYLRFEGLPLWILLTYLCLVVLIAIVLRERLWNESLAQKELALI